MKMLESVLVFMLCWFALSVVVGLVVGRSIRCMGDTPEETRAPSRDTSRRQHSVEVSRPVFR
jgi:hypothetical protein